MRFAVCNELFGDVDIERDFATIRESGFQGVELAPHTIFGDFAGGTYTGMDPTISRIRRALGNEGLAFVGLHWLLVGPPDLHVTSPDDEVWRRSWEHVGRLADLAGELGGGVMVFGSPHQRASKGLMQPDDALDRFLDGLMTVAERAADADSTILLEALGSSNTDVMNTLEEVRAIVRRLSHPAVGTLFDFHNVEDESLDWAGLVAEYAEVISHVHLNEPDGEAPQPDSPNLPAFRAAFEALKAAHYASWVSLEMFSFPDDPGAVLRGVRTFLDDVMS